MKNPPPSFDSTGRHRPWGVLPSFATLGLVWACVAMPAFSQSDMPQAWQPGELANTTQTDEHQEVRKLLRQAKYSAALIWIEGSLAKNPRDPQMLFWQAFVFEQTARADKALPIYLSLTQDFPELPEPHNNLGVLYAAQGDYARAKASFDLAIRNNPSYAVAHENLGDVLLHLSQQSYQRALSLEPKQLSAHKKIQQLKPALELSERK